jgi:integral membrane sensor domain MASE1/anti-sigma regulatory factor (Ser/Thr protein kinase)
VKRLALAGLVVAAYYGSAKIGLDLAFATSSVTAIWPPSGIALAALVLLGPRYWPAVALGAFLANAWTDVPLITTLGITTGNTLEAVVGAYLLRRVGFDPALKQSRDVLALALLAAVLSTAISATIGVISLGVGDEIDWDDFASVWRVWWLGDMGGDLLVAPLILVFASRSQPFRELPGSPLELAALALAAIGTSVLVFSQDTTIVYLVFPVLIWACLRFWQVGATAVNFAVATAAVVFTANEHGPFVRDNADDSLLLAQGFVGVAGVTALGLAAVVSERAREEQVIEYIAKTLQEGLLPSVLPDIPGVELAVRFRPAGDMYRVGGDFYDAFETGDGSWSIAVGDVCGKGPAAAAVTGLARYTLRAAAIDRKQPSEVLALLNDAVVRQRAPEEFCTVAYVRLDNPVGGPRVTFSTGGHPLPLLLRADGSVETLGRPGLLVGMLPAARFADHEVELQPGDALLLFTDGLTEAYAPEAPLRPHEVAGVLATCSGLSAEGIAARIESAALGRTELPPRDDIALLVMRLAPMHTAGEGVELTVPLGEEREAPAAARRAVRKLEGQVSAGVLGDLHLLTNELVSNSIRHGIPPVELRLRTDERCVRIEVHDRGHGFEPPPPPEHGDETGSGWGLYLVEILADRWGVSPTENGTCVWYEIDRQA